MLPARIIGFSDGVVLGSGMQCPQDSNEFTPASISGLEVWYRGDLGVTLNSQTINNSNAFNAWSTTGCSVSANVAADPLGGATADGLTENSSNSEHSITHATVAAFAPGSTYTVSVYAKANGRRYLGLEANLRNCFFDLESGIVGSSSDPGVVGTISNAGNGWWKCTISFTSTLAHAYVVIYLANANAGAGATYLGDGSSGVYLYQVEITGGTVSAWADQSGNGRHAAQPTAAIQPAYSSANATYNGQAALTGDGGDWMATLAFAAPLPTPWTLVFAGHCTSLANVSFIGGGSAYPRAQVEANGASPSCWRVFTNALSASVTDQAANPTVLLWSQASNTVNIYANQTAAADVSAVLADVTFQEMSLFCYDGGGAPSAGTIAEVMLYSKTLSAEERTELMTYLADRYNITLA